MAPNSMFGREGDGDEPAGSDEGVRLLKSEEVAEVAERAETARRRGPDEKKYGDRPETPPADVRPAMRFPLAGSASPTDLGRPRPAPVSRPGEPAGDDESFDGYAAEASYDDPSFEGDAGSYPAGAGDDPDEAYGRYDDQRADADYDDGVGYGDEDDSYAEDPDEVAVGSGAPDPVVLFDADTDDDDAPGEGRDWSWPGGPDDEAAVPAEGQPSGPVLSVGPPTGETTLPHWTEPATGEVPRIVAGADVGDGDDDRWAAFAGSAPRWRDEHTDWSREDDTGFHDLVAAEDGPLGALDESDRLMDEEYLTFDDLDVPDAAPPTSTRRGPGDPIKIQRSSGATAAARADARRRASAGAGPPERDRGPSSGRTPPSGRDRDQAVKVGMAIAVGALLVLLVGALSPLKWLPLLLVVPAVVGCLGELFNATARAGFRPITVVGLVAGAAMPVAAYFAGTPTAPAGESGIMLVLVLAVAASMAWYLFGAGKGRPVANIAITLAGILYVAVLGSYAALILRAGPWPDDTASDVHQGIALFILIGVGTTMYDVAGYLLGSRVGKTPLSAASPNKTVEGLVCGMGATFLTVALLGSIGLGVRNPGQALVLGLVLAVVAPVGDLFESMIKRDLGVKDMSNLIPAHGGLLDRVDAYLFTLPAGFYTLRMLGLL